MPIKIKDADGNEHEVFVQADLDAALQTQQESFDAKLAELTKDPEPVAIETKDPVKAADNEPPAWFKEWQEKEFSTVAHNQNRQYVDTVVSSLDADKQKDVRAKFDSLVGYANTPEGMKDRANDAYVLVMGERPAASAVDLSNLNAGGGGRPNISDGHAGNAEVDKPIQDALGITPEDVAKYAKK